MPKQSKQSQIDELERTLRIEQHGIQTFNLEMVQLKKRVAEIAAENESLRADKKWLQQMHSQVLQALFFKAQNGH